MERLSFIFLKKRRIGVVCAHIFGCIFSLHLNEPVNGSLISGKQINVVSLTYYFQKKKRFRLISKDYRSTNYIILHTKCGVVVAGYFFNRNNLLFSVQV